MCWMEEWVKGACHIQTFRPSLTSSFALVAPRDPMRFAITLPGVQGQTMFIDFGNQPGSSATFTIEGSSQWLFLLAKDLGDLVTEPVWMVVAPGPANVTFKTMSFNPHRKARYDEWIERNLSRASTP